jgi:RHS repeat-associated protein
MVQTYSYDAFFPHVFSDMDLPFKPYKFTGKERDSESGLDNFGARYNSSQYGRFMTPDPMGGHYEDPQTLNRYSYVRNNPLSLTDPTGLDFYLQCTDQEHKNCTQVEIDKNKTWVQAQNGQATIITSDSIRAGQNTANVDEHGVEINGNNHGIYFSNPASHTTDANGNDINHNPIDLAGSGALRNFSFNINGNCSGTCLASGTFQYNGTPDQTRELLDARGAFRSIVDRTIPIWGQSLDEHFEHPNTTQHRFDDAPSPHFSVPRDPRATVPTIGPFRVDTNAPGIRHAGCAWVGVGCY